MPKRYLDVPQKNVNNLDGSAMYLLDSDALILYGTSRDFRTLASAVSLI